MIEIKTPSGYLDLEERFSIKIENESPVFSTELLKGAYSLPINFPFTENNNKITKHVNLLSTSSNAFFKIEVEVYIQGTFYKNALLKLSKSTNAYRGYLLFDVGSIAEPLKNRTLKSIDFGKYEITRFHYFKIYDATLFNSGTLTARIRTFYVEKDVTTPFDTDLETTLSNLADLISEDPTLSKSMIVTPSTDDFTFYLDFFVDAKLLDDSLVEMPVFWSTFEREMFQDISDHAVLAADKSNGFNHVFFPYKNPVIKEQYTTFKSYVNHYHDGKLTFLEWPNGINSAAGEIQDDGDVHNYLCGASLYFEFVYKKVLAEVGLELVLEGDLKEAFFERLVLFSPYTQDEVVANASGEFYNVWDNLIDYNLLVPEISFSDLIKVANTFCCAFFFDLEQKTLTIKPNKNIIKETKRLDLSDYEEDVHEIDFGDDIYYNLIFEQDTADELVETNIKSLEGFDILSNVEKYADLPIDFDEVGKLRFVENVNTYYLGVQDDTDTVDLLWQPYATVPQNYINERREKEDKLEVKASPVQMIEEEDELNAGRRWCIPQSGYGLSSKGYKTGKITAKPRLLFYAGLREDSQGNDYPLATTDNKDHTGASIPNMDFPLRWEGDEGLYNLLWKEWVEFLRTSKPIVKRFNLPYHILQKIKWDIPIYSNGQKYLIVSYSLEVQQDGISMTTFHLRKF